MICVRCLIVSAAATISFGLRAADSEGRRGRLASASGLRERPGCTLTDR